MSGPPDPTSLAAALWELLPVVYRTRDGVGPAAPENAELGDLARLLVGTGALLDAVRATLDQRLADAFPDAPPAGGRAAQAWLLPYFARLVDAKLRSPHVAGRRREVAEAIAWRQRKGTLGAAEAIAEAASGRAVSGIGGREVELQEGLRRVAVTARTDRPPVGRLPVAPGTTVRVDAPMRAVRLPADAPGARRSSFGGPALISWRIGRLDGVPCFAEHFDDASRRTVDVRPPSTAAGHAHPKRLLVHAAPPLGFFPPPPRGAPEDAPLEATVELTGDEAEPLRARRIGTLRLPAGQARLEGCTVDAIEAGADAAVRARDCALGGIAAAGAAVELDACTITGAVTAGELTARASVSSAPDDAVRVTVAGDATVASSALRAVAVGGALDAARSVLGTATVAGRARLEYVTVLRETEVGAIEASDCLFTGRLAVTAAAAGSGIRYSRLPRDAEGLGGVRTFRTTRARALFVDARVCGIPADDAFAQPGLGVLHPETDDAVRFGAEDGGELGAFHDEAHTLEQRALLEQVADHLPHGLRPVLLLDARLHRPPPALPDPA